MQQDRNRINHKRIPRTIRLSGDFFSEMLQAFATLQGMPTYIQNPEKEILY